MDKPTFTETYAYRVACENCRNWAPFELPKGVHIGTVKHELVCPNCGCPIITPNKVKKAY